MPKIGQSSGITAVSGALGVLRARQWVHFAVLPAAGLDRAALGTPAALARGMVAAAAASFALAYAYGINALADRANDGSVAKNPLAGLERVPAAALAALAGAVVGALSLGGLLGPRALVLVIASIIAATVYSVAPRMKALPLLGLLFNIAIFVPLLGLALPDGAPPRPYGVLCTTFVGLLVQSQLLHEAGDAQEDEAAGALTTARLLGGRWTRAAAVGISVPAAVVGFALAPRPFVGWAAALALGAGAAVALLQRDPAEARRRLRPVAAAGGALVFVAGLFS